MKPRNNIRKEKYRGFNLGVRSPEVAMPRTHSMSAKKYGSWNEETTSEATAPRQPMIHSVYFLTDVASVTNQPLLLLQFLIYTVATSSMEFYCRDDVVTPGS